MAAGAVIEALADRQKTEYSKQDRSERPDVLDTGLWGWSRHPDYFGDSLVWDGAWLTAAASSPAGWTLPAPALMSYLLMFAAGRSAPSNGCGTALAIATTRGASPSSFPGPRSGWV